MAKSSSSSSSALVLILLLSLTLSTANAGQVIQVNADNKGGVLLNRVTAHNGDILLIRTSDKYITEHQLSPDGVYEIPAVQGWAETNPLLPGFYNFNSPTRAGPTFSATVSS